MQGGTLARIPLDKIGIEPKTGLGIFQCRGGILLLKVGGTAIAKIDMIGAIEINGSRVVFNRFGSFASLECLVSLGLGLQYMNVGCGARE